MTTNENDPDFIEAMHDLLDMDEAAVETLLDEIDKDDLQSLMDAVAQKDREAAQRIVRQFNTESDVNSLFRGKNLKSVDLKKKRKSNKDGKFQFAFGDEVFVKQYDDDGKPHNVTGTVSNPHGPEGTNTMTVRIKGKSVQVDRNDVDRLEEGVLGMIGLPELGRIQQLAGIQSQQTVEPVTQVVQPDQQAEPSPHLDEPSAQAMAALDVLEAVLPCITVADLKAVRQRLMALQAMLNEGSASPSLGRARKF